jgi:hypothetical protein
MENILEQVILYLVQASYFCFKISMYAIASCVGFLIIGFLLSILGDLLF